MPKFSLFAVKYLIMLLFRVMNYNMNFIKLVLVWIFAVLFINNVFAQKTYIYRFDSVRNYVESSSYGHVKVIDMRVDKATFGKITARKNMITEKPLADEIEAYGNAIVSKSNSKEAELLIVLQDMYADATCEVPSLRIKAQYYLGIKDEYHSIFLLDSLFEGRVNVKRLIADRLARQFIKAAAKYISNSKGETIEEILTNVEQEPAYKHTVFPVGIYYTVHQFLSANPVDTDFIIVDKYIDHVYTPFLFIKKENGKKGKEIQPKEIFAVYDGKRWLKGAGNRLAMMAIENGWMVYKDYGKALALSSMGLIGALVVTEENGFDEHKGPFTEGFYKMVLNSNGTSSRYRRLK